jgi:hypothetical protein
MADGLNDTLTQGRFQAEFAGCEFARYANRTGLRDGGTHGAPPAEDAMGVGWGTG